MPQIWRLNAAESSGKGQDSNAFCIENDVVGFGWPVEPDEDLLEWEIYAQRGREKYRTHSGSGADWWNAVSSLKNRMVTGDLCWARNPSGKYYLGRVLGVWQYRSTEGYREAGVVNTRYCQWFEAGDAFEVPGSILNAFRSPRVLQRVPGEGIEVFSGFRFNGLAQKSHYEFSQRPCELFSLLSPGECEDLVGIFLQMQGFLILPGSCKTDTKQFEFLLRHQTSGRHAAVRVRNGYDPIDVGRWDQFDGDVFLFQKSGKYAGAPQPNVKCISADELLQFSLVNVKVLPASLQRWLKVWHKVVGTEESFLS
jgi:hypothetical protein